MTNFSGLGLGLSLVFGCLLLALVAELYYLLWWKKKRITDSREMEDEYGNFAKELFHFICRKRTIDPTQPSSDHPDLRAVEEQRDHAASPAKPVAGEDTGGVESELMRLHNLAGPPRFLFTIKEETREDMESDDGRSRKGSRTRSLSDLMDTLFLTPLQSPPPALTTVSDNPLFESTSESAELTRPRSSPPPKFKFLRDAEEKLYRRLAEEAEKKKRRADHRVVTVVVGSEKVPQCPSGSSQVLPLSSSPTAFKVQTISC